LRNEHYHTAEKRPKKNATEQCKNRDKPYSIHRNIFMIFFLDCLKSLGFYYQAIAPQNLPTTWWQLRAGGGIGKARTGGKVPNSQKSVSEHTPRLTPNRTLLAGSIEIVE
jgi:hypothetical protein